MNTVNNDDIKKAVEEALLKCSLSERFIIFIGVVTEEKDVNGHDKIEYSYIRENFPFEDLPKSVAVLRQHIWKDLGGV